MINNDILRRLRYTFDYNDNKMIAIFAHAGFEVSRVEISSWLKKEEDPDFRKCVDVVMARFLSGFIIEHRGKKDGEQPPIEKQLDNNIILRKLKIALKLQDNDVLDIMLKANFKMSKHELSAFFRRPEHKNYRECQDQVLRNFMKGLQAKYREGSFTKTNPSAKSATAAKKASSTKAFTPSKNKPSTKKETSNSNASVWSEALKNKKAK